ncbi:MULTISPECIES: H-NS histone family protein [Deefgea]|uniref:H-NS histone family protein n=1 Tax=Deefgea chitinilytica TaxID=570276 RepID=A0ABS2CCR6_9NEIS|nr:MULTISPECIES: H-NS histone family protein [Deefgea]MBM5571933.1 H-NS histone family protein [Deefgea chitinilytica]MBM9889168.1 H-NS histone family protein [Deefgea sp. CFH1-16]
MDLSTLGYQELVELRTQLDGELVRRKEQEKSRILSQLQSAAAASGFTIAELLGEVSGKKGAKKAPAAAAYMNPADASQTWSGRGRKPQWVHDAIANGATLDTLKI